MKILILLASQLMAASYHFNKSADIGKLQKELIAAGFAVEYIYCANTRCEIVFQDGETKDPSEIVAAHRDGTETRALIKSLVLKLKSGTITKAERDRLIDLVLLHVMGAQ